MSRTYMHFWGSIFWKKDTFSACTPIQVPFLVKTLFLKAQSTRLHAIVTLNKGLELTQCNPISWSISFKEWKYNENLKTLWSVFMDEIQLSQGYRTNTRDSFSFNNKFPGASSWYSFEWPWKDKKGIQSWSYPVVLNTRPLDCESSTVTTKLLLQLETNIWKK